MPRRLIGLASVVLVCAYLCSSAAFSPAQVATLVRPAAVRLVPEKLQAIDALLDSLVQKRQIAGAVALLWHNGRDAYLHTAGLQDIDSGRPMVPDTLFRIASMTKPVTSAAVMTLVDAGKLRLTDPLAKFLPEFRDMKVLVPGAEGQEPKVVPAERPITIHDLLTHTSGISYRFSSQGKLHDLYNQASIHDGLCTTGVSLEENVLRLSKLPLAAQPGSAWEYGLSIDVLGRVVEAVSGKDLETYFKEHIFRPLKMNNTAFSLAEDRQPRIAGLYTPTGPERTIQPLRQGRVKIGEVIISADYPFRSPRAYPSGGAGLVSTAPDYARFLQMLLNGGELDGVRLLRPETVRLMTQNQVGSINIPYSIHGDKFGYGFGVVTPAGKPKTPASVGSYSWGGIFNTFFWVDPEKRLVGVVMTQLFPYSHLNLWADFQKRAYEALAE